MEFIIFLISLLFGFGLFILGVSKDPRMSALMGLGSLIIITTALAAFLGVYNPSVQLNYQVTHYTYAGTSSNINMTNVTDHYIIQTTQYNNPQDNTMYLLLLLSGLAMLFASFFVTIDDENE